MLSNYRSVACEDLPAIKRAMYRSVACEDLPAIKRAMRRVPDEFRASEVLPHFPVVLQDIEPRELGRALLYRGLAARAAGGKLRRLYA